VIFIETLLRDAYVVEVEPVEDNRGFFARTCCDEELQRHGLSTRFVQCSISFNKRKGTLRGLHYQVKPYEESKLVRCTMGAIYDVMLDLRKDSESFGQWFAIELSAENRSMVYVPGGVAHGFQTLTDNSEVFYQTSEFYAPEYAEGVRWDDPWCDIHWPLDVATISDKDKNFPLFG
jgi:dTDP-4-dehydrorhamnose 3,5-epimerase